MISAELTRYKGKALLGRMRNHVVVTDRPPTDGGQDLGCTSGELLLMSLGSCVMGSLASYVDERALPFDIVKTDVFIEQPTVRGGFGRLVISAELDGALTPEELRALTEIAGSGRVVRRLRGSAQIDIRVMCSSTPQPRRRDGAEVRTANTE